MRQLLVLALPFLLLAGCSGATGDGASDGADDLADDADNMAALPPLHWANDVLVGADPFNFLPTDPADPTSLAGPGPCSQDVSTCYYHDFTVPGNASVDLTATLKWMRQADDFDLYLYQGDTLVTNDGINNADPTNPTSLVPLTEQVLHATIAPGDYTFWVVAWNAASESYVLDAAFA